jgi:hypothetical protein
MIAEIKQLDCQHKIHEIPCEIQPKYDAKCHRPVTMVAQVITGNDLFYFQRIF